MNNILGLVLSFIFVFVVIGLSTLLQKLNVLKEEGARKFIHIGVSNWWFFVNFMFDNIWWAIIAPIVFIVLNYLSYRYNLIKSMERNGDGNLGTVYFPISLLILTIAAFTFLNPYISGIGILVLGYGDGLAAVIGKMIPSKKLFGNKSLSGTLTMFLASFIVIVLYTLLATNINLIVDFLMIKILVISLAAAVTELFTPNGLDNLSIPILVSLLSFLLI